MPFESHCILELMGHQRIAGKVVEQEIAGTASLRVDVPKVDGIDAFTKFYSAGAIYSITPVDEATCLRAVAAFREHPVEVWRFAPESPLLAAKVVHHVEPGWDVAYDNEESADENDADDLDREETPGCAAHLRQLKTQAARWAKTITDGRDFVVLDFETTGLTTTEARIVQVSVLDGKTGNILFDKLVNPGIPIPAEATAVHGITDGMVKDAPSFKEILAATNLIGLLNDKPVIAYNSAYENNVFNEECRRHEQKIPYVNWQCAMLHYADFYGDWNDFRGNCKWQKLADACARESITVEAPAHSALGDCRRTLALVQRMAAWKPADTSAIPF